MPLVLIQKKSATHISVSWMNVCIILSLADSLAHLGLRKASLVVLLIIWKSKTRVTSAFEIYKKILMTLYTFFFFETMLCPCDASIIVVNVMWVSSVSAGA